MIRRLLIGFFLVLIMVGSFALSVDLSLAQGSPLDGTPADPRGNFATCEGPDCNYCDVVELIERVIRWLVLVLTIIGTLLFVYAGFMLSSSQGDVGKYKKAKDMIVSVVIGLIVLLSSWMIIDVIMKAFVGGDVGVWNSVTENCGGQNAAPLPAGISINPDTGEYEPVEFGDSQIFVQDTIVSVEGPEVVSRGSSGSGQITPTVGQVSFAFSSSLNTNQQGHLSGALATFQNCIARNALPGQYVITSVSDNMIANGSRSWEQCAAGQCQHSANSCHYGGRSCVGSSYALDMSVRNITSQQANSIVAAARQCGGFGDIHGPDEHIHVSIGGAAGCGCN